MTTLSDDSVMTPVWAELMRVCTTVARSKIFQVALKLLFALAVGKILEGFDEPLGENDRELSSETRVVRHQIVEQGAINDEKLRLLRHPDIRGPLGAREQGELPETIPTAEIGERRTVGGIGRLRPLPI